LLRADPEVAGHLSQSDFESVFDYGYFLRHVDEIFEQAGLG
jgi:hypothetical protein